MRSVITHGHVTAGSPRAGVSAACLRARKMCKQTIPPRAPLMSWRLATTPSAIGAIGDSLSDYRNGALSDYRSYRSTIGVYYRNRTRAQDRLLAGTPGNCVPHAFLQLVLCDAEHGSLGPNLSCVLDFAVSNEIVWIVMNLEALAYRPLPVQGCDGRCFDCSAAPRCFHFVHRS